MSVSRSPGWVAVSSSLVAVYNKRRYVVAESYNGTLLRSCRSRIIVDAMPPAMQCRSWPLVPARSQVDVSGFVTPLPRIIITVFGKDCLMMAYSDKNVFMNVSVCWFVPAALPARTFLYQMRFCISMSLSDQWQLLASRAPNGRRRLRGQGSHNERVG